MDDELRELAVAKVPHLLPRGRSGDCRQRRPSHPGGHASDSLLHMGRHVPGRIVCSQGQSSTPHVQPVGNTYNNLDYSHIADEIDWMLLITSVNVYICHALFVKDLHRHAGQLRRPVFRAIFGLVDNGILRRHERLASREPSLLP